MTAYQKLTNLIIEYLENEGNSDASDKFCTKYMDMYFELSDQLSIELAQKKFEAFDDLNLVCDSYETNPQIREGDKFCIDEKQLKDKVLFCLDTIKG